MDKSKLRHFEKILLEDRAEIVEDLMLTNEDFAGFEKINSGGDLVDQATKFYEKELLISLNTTEKETLRLINKALLKIKDSTFGFCESCKKEIDTKRLEAIPYTTLCMDCKKKLKKPNSKIREDLEYTNG